MKLTESLIAQRSNSKEPVANEYKNVALSTAMIDAKKQKYDEILWYNPKTREYEIHKLKETK